MWNWNHLIKELCDCAIHLPYPYVELKHYCWFTFCAVKLPYPYVELKHTTKCNNHKVTKTSFYLILMWNWNSLWWLQVLLIHSYLILMWNWNKNILVSILFDYKADYLILMWNWNYVAFKRFYFSFPAGYLILMWNWNIYKTSLIGYLHAHYLILLWNWNNFLLWSTWCKAHGYLILIWNWNNVTFFSVESFHFSTLSLCGIETNPICSDCCYSLWCKLPYPYVELKRIFLTLSWTSCSRFGYLILMWNWNKCLYQQNAADDRDGDNLPYPYVELKRLNPKSRFRAHS